MPGPRLTQRGRQTRERIIDTAAALVQARGAQLTSLDDVLAGSRTSKSQLYHYFGGKPGLLQAVIAHQAGRVHDFHRELLRDAHTMGDLRAWATATTNEAIRQGLSGCPLGSLAGELLHLSEDYRHQLVRGFAGWQDLLERAITGAQEGSEVRTDQSAAELAADVLGALEGGLLMAHTQRSPDPLRRALDMALEHLATEVDPKDHFAARV